MCEKNNGIFCASAFACQEHKDEILNKYLNQTKRKRTKQLDIDIVVLQNGSLEVVNRQFVLNSSLNTNKCADFHFVFGIRSISTKHRCINICLTDISMTILAPSSPAQDFF